MAEQSFTLNNSQTQKIRIEPGDVRGNGGKESPILIVPIELSVAPLKHNGYSQNFNLIGVDVNLRTRELNSIIAKASVTNFWKVRYENSYTYSIEFQLDSYRISKIEDRRVDDLILTLEVKLHVGYYSSIQLNKNDPQSTIEFITDFQSVQIQLLNVQIPQSHWVSKVLPALGYNAVQIIEIPITSQLIGETQKISLKELKLANDYFLRGDYDKSVSHCRTALEPLRKKLLEVKDKIESKSEREWIVKITESTENWLETVIKNTYFFTSKTHHTPSVGHFSRHEAEVVFALTTSIISYAGKFDPMKYNQE